MVSVIHVQALGQNYAEELAAKRLGVTREILLDQWRVEKCTLVEHGVLLFVNCWTFEHFLHAVVANAVADMLKDMAEYEYRRQERELIEGVPGTPMPLGIMHVTDLMKFNPDKKARQAKRRRAKAKRKR